MGIGKIFYNTALWGYGLIDDVMADFALSKERHINKSKRKIRVAFLCQYIPAWGKMEALYKTLKTDKRFDTYLLCVPLNITKHKLVEPDSLLNDTYEYFTEQGYDEAINTLIGREKWLDLKKLELDYVFCCRTYNTYMPREYSNHAISRYARVCVLLYALALIQDTYSSVFNDDFFRYTYCYYAETAYSELFYRQKYRKKIQKKVKRSVYYGAPFLETFYNEKDSPAPIWDFSKNDFRAIWSPRWTTDKSLGGTNFFEYKDVLTEYAGTHKDIDFVFRPHPLMFDNFIKTGEMSKKEVEIFKTKIDKSDNIVLDNEKKYEATMWKSSVLISDPSSIVAEYFSIGKPVIYCDTNTDVKNTKMTDRMLEGCYVVKNKDELVKTIDELRLGKDYLSDKREEIRKELFGDDMSGISAKIADDLFDDYKHRLRRQNETKTS
ncbi:MAG: CDP-glycerol glycerophosphotransferase family protein [Lachnospiraceae bacterium]|nr:CDP-glycerol glycerophosphotransferase family protein [Lachnospiraceae bacterium]